MIRTLLIAATALLALAPAAQAAHPGQDGRIVYQVDQSAQSMKPSGKDRVRIAKGNISEPSVSPDGRHVAFTRNPHHTSGVDDIWVMRANGNHRERLTKGTPDDAGPTYSPDGRQIAFSRSGTLCIMDADGRHLRRIAHVRGGLYRPSFTPDGRSLVADGAGTGLYRARLRDGKVRQLTDERDFSPDFGPGALFVFSSYRETDATTELYTMNLDGTDLTRVTHDEHSDDSPVLSPDGTRIAFTHYTTSKLVGEDQDFREKGARIRVMNVDGSGAHNLRPGFGPSWTARSR